MKKIKQPLVSVIMPVYNAGDFLVPAIESILKQTYKNIDFLIVDDCSTDNSWKTISKYQKISPKIKIYKLRKNTNEAGNGALNKVLKYAKGKYIARMDADDIAYPQRIAKQVKFMEKHPEIIVLGTQAEVIDKNNQILGTKKFPLTHKEIYQEYGLFNPLLHPSCMFRGSLLPSKNRIYEEKFGVNDDYYTFFKLLNYGKFANLPQSLMQYRIHGANFSLTKPKERFITSLRIRFKAIKYFHYKISLKAVFLTLIQCLVILPLPERFIVPLYLFLRGIKSTHVVLEKPQLTLSKISLQKCYAYAKQLLF